MANNNLFPICRVCNNSHFQGPCTGELHLTADYRPKDFLPQEERDKLIRQQFLQELKEAWGESYFTSVHNETEHYIKIKPEDFKKLDFIINIKMDDHD